ncbi:2031_t:CDS:2, partial [Racocetra persica]
GERRSVPKHIIKTHSCRPTFVFSCFFALFVAFVAHFWFFPPVKRSSSPEESLVVWVKHPQHTDPIKVHVPYNADVADVKKVVKQELQPALDKESLGNVVILSPKLGRLDPRTLIRKVALDINEHLIAFVDNLDSRLFIKRLTNDQLPLQVNAPLCLTNDEAYIVVVKVLMGQYSQQDVVALKNSLCDSSIESWSSKYSYAKKFYFHSDKFIAACNVTNPEKQDRIEV